MSSSYTPQEVLMSQGREYRTHHAEIGVQGEVADARVTGFQRRDGVVFYSVDVRGAGKPFRLWKRYSQFCHLRSVLDKTATDTETRFAASSFPPKTPFRECTQLDPRCRALDSWLTVQLGAARRLAGRSGDERRRLIAEFLDSSQAPQVPTDLGASLGAPALMRESTSDVQGRVTACELRDGLAFYKIDVGAGASTTVWKSYSQFDDLKRRIGPLGPPVPFPGKILIGTEAWSRARQVGLSGLSEEGRAARLRGLNNWLQACLSSASTELTGTYQETMLQMLADFFDPAMEQRVHVSELSGEV
eukprot:TRINITY_DN3168_c1_g1_i1.p1 TRINITY_DN3168_c1_g1~~TRINITY_DN3168_c1_g1_i1.p1  ORF type:complete len:303 (+),score=61.01 TRINITY_DN3168_c1_g1_i1:92-1000(+)